MTTQADEPENIMMTKNQSGEKGGPQNPGDVIPELALDARTARLRAISQEIHNGQYHVPAAALAERILERLMYKDRPQVG